MTRALIDLTGQTFGDLTVLRRADKTSQGHIRWICRCVCRREYEVIGLTLRNGTTTSCKFCRLLPAGEFARNSLYTTYRKQAENRGYAFELTMAQFEAITQHECVYCGSVPSQSYKPRGCATAYIYNGIDRVNNGYGYIWPNCVSCCGICNKMKGTMARDEFISHLQRIVAFVNSLAIK